MSNVDNLTAIFTRIERRNDPKHDRIKLKVEARLKAAREEAARVPVVPGKKK